MRKTEKLLKHLMYISRQEREKRAYCKYTQKRLRLEKLSINQLKFQRITLKAKYEHKRNIYAIFLGAILLSILTGTWGTLFDLTGKIIEYASVQTDPDPLFVKGWTIIVVIFFVTATLLILIAALSFIRSLYHLNEELLMVEDALKEKTEHRK